MIKKFTQYIFILFILIGYPASLLKAQTPIWSDEFNGTFIDPTVWTYDVSGGGMGNGELEFNTDRPANSFVQNGNLVIQAQRENYQGNQFTSARLKTLGRFSFKYGTIVARIKLPDLTGGLWPAFWLMGTDIGQVGWPKCGEFDIMEAGSQAARTANLTNKQINGSAHWWQDNGTWGAWLQADATAPYTLPAGTLQDYHTYKMVWDSTHIEYWIDSTRYFNMSTSDPNMSEFRKPQYIILNMAVGGTNWVNLTTPAQITATLPAQMLVDYVRIYPIAGQTQVYNDNANQVTGTYGVFSDRTTIANKLNFAKDGHIYQWNNISNGTGAAYEGTSVLNWNMAAGSWWGAGILDDNNLNMTGYSDGTLHIALKTTCTDDISIGVNSYAGESYVVLSTTGNQYGLVRDGNWHEVNIPLNLFAVDFSAITQPFEIKGNAPASAISISIDDIYWLPSSPRPTPSNGNFGVYTDNTVCSSKFVQGTNGNFFVWSNTLTPITSAPSEGSNVLAYTSAAGLSWFGAAFTPSIKYNLTAFRYSTSKLHFDLKTSSTTAFQIGMKSGNTPNLNQTWINFANGADPYGFVRDGNWHGVDIPMSDFSNVDLSQVNQLFELLGTTGAISSIAIDNIYFSGGGAPIGSTVSVTGVSLSQTTGSIIVGKTLQLAATIIPSNATNTAVTFSSSNAAIATVSATGLVTAVAPGTATITLTTTDGNKTATCAVTVTPVLVTSVSLSPTTLSLLAGAKGQLTPTVLPSNATNKAVTYTSSNTAVATVSASGLVTAAAAGTAAITVKTTDGGKTATCAVTVTNSCSKLASTGDFSTTVSSDASNPTLTFVPAKTGMGATTCILYYSTSATGTFPGYNVTANTPFRITAAAGQTVYFYYTYSLPTGGENNTSATKNSFTVGNCSTLKSAEIGSSDAVAAEGMVVYPNPVDGETVNIGLTGFEDGKANVQILNMAGSVVREIQIPTSASASTVAINISGLSNGAYIVLLQSGSDVKQAKLLINR